MTRGGRPLHGPDPTSDAVLCDLQGGICAVIRARAEEEARGLRPEGSRPDGPEGGAT